MRKSKADMGAKVAAPIRLCKAMAFPIKCRPNLRLEASMRSVNGTRIETRDGATIGDEQAFRITAIEDAQLVLAGSPG